ncbi:tetratricopeptide repeat protein 38 [Exaiptasia diaphana]|uniref:Tetratricopeptide repeat protein 38 n=1 Tax=Exaiptasia diaphana TaxID=2652724 RepID=A0A913Y0X7_EXADI|nr:tetratricopeptide repeat protein 38 [Exaiptasia diaphana]KXJ23457.1 Tetratricopeptide repeat protein 38 [Exaiptasia diaphana]
MSYMHTQWRDLDAWKKEGLFFSTTSNEAVKLYDAALTQYTGWYEEPSVGGLEKTMSDLIQADPEFVMGHVMCNGLELISTTYDVDTNPKLKEGMDTLANLVAKGNINDRERMHAQAVKEWSDGNAIKACQIWEDILTNHPNDMFALKMAHDTYFYFGLQAQMRDSVASVMPRWKETTPLYCYLHGMYAFGLVETNMYQDAEKQALKGLELNPRDCWSTHAQAHVLEMMGRQDEGIGFLSKTMNDWTKGAMLACHNYWHWALYHIEKGEYDAAVDVYDSQVGQRVKSGAMLDLVDASSLLYRLQMEGVAIGNRWGELLTMWQPHAHDHITAFNDVHMLMCTLGSKREDKTQELMESLRSFVEKGSGVNRDVTQNVGLPLCEAFELVDKNQHDVAVEILKPLRYRIVQIGGSNAQRDLFNLFFINTAMTSSRKDHHRLARRLLSERKALKENAPMTDRLIARAMASHVE